MEIDQELLERSRVCPICNRVVSALRAGHNPVEALTEGLVAASITAEEVRNIATDIAMRAGPPPVMVDLPTP